MEREQTDQRKEEGRGKIIRVKPYEPVERGPGKDRQGTVSNFLVKWRERGAGGLDLDGVKCLIGLESKLAAERRGEIYEMKRRSLH